MSSNILRRSSWNIKTRWSPAAPRTSHRDPRVEIIGPKAYRLRICCTLGYLEGQGDLVSSLIRGISRVTIWVIGVINLLTKTP